MHIKFFSIEYTKLNDIIKSNHKINIRRDLIMSFYKKMVSVCAAVALSTSIIPVIPVSADTGMTRYEAERQYTLLANYFTAQCRELEHFHYYLCRQPKAAEWRLV